jgi:hypothetical protein
MKKFSEQEQEALLDVLRRHEQELKAYRGRPTHKVRDSLVHQ